MIKIIAFDLVGVLLGENDFDLNDKEDKIERLFGKNKNDEEVISEATKLTNLSKDEVIKIIKNIIFKIYDVKVNISKIKNKYKDVRLFVASNHVSYIKEFLNEKFGEVFDDVIISSCINAYKPDKKFYEVLIKRSGVKPDEILFLDDRLENVDAARRFGIKSELVEEYNVLEIIDKYIGDKNERDNL